MAAVFGHLAVTVVHGGAHAGAHVGTSAWQNAFILIVIEIGPLAGLWLSLRRPVLGGWMVTATMTGALVFGVVNHFVLPGPDRIDHVAGAWSVPFAASAGVLAIMETAGAVAGIRYARRPMEPSS